MSHLIKATAHVQSGSGRRAFHVKTTLFKKECIVCVQARTAYTLVPRKFWAIERKKEGWVEKCVINCGVKQTSTTDRSLTSAHLVASLFQTALNSSIAEECGHSLGLQAVKVLDL